MANPIIINTKQVSDPVSHRNLLPSLQGADPWSLDRSRVKARAGSICTQGTWDQCTLEVNPGSGMHWSSGPLVLDAMRGSVRNNSG